MFEQQTLSYRFVRFKIPWRVKKNVKLKNRVPRTFSRIRFELGQRSRTDVLDFYLPKGIRHRIVVVYVCLIRLWVNYRENGELEETGVRRV